MFEGKDITSGIIVFVFSLIVNRIKIHNFLKVTKKDILHIIKDI